MSRNFPTDPTALGFTVLSLSIALEETLRPLPIRMEMLSAHGSMKSKTWRFCGREQLWVNA